MKLIPLLGLVLALLAAPALALERLGQPCRAFNVLAGRVVTDSAGTEWFVLTNMNESSGMELIFINIKDNTAKTFKAPAGAGSWALLQVPGDRLVVGTYYDGTFMVFDLKKMAFVKSTKFPGEEYIWNLALGSDGRVYGGTYRGAKLGALDLGTYAVEDLGRPDAAAPNLYLRNVSSTPDGRILCNFGTEKKVTLLFDPKTKQFSEVPAHLKVDRGVTWNDKYFIAGRQVMTGPELKMVKPPFPIPAPAKGEKPDGVMWSVDPLATTNDTLIMRHGNAIYRYRDGDKALTKMFDGSLRGGALYAANAAGDLLGVRGPEYFVLSAGKPIEFRRIPTEPGPRGTHFLRYDSKRNRVWGGPTFGQTVFWLDVQSKKFENTAKVCDSGGEVYDATFIDGIVYLVAYAGGDVIRYDPDQPWDQWGGKNPRVIASVKAMGEGYIRPVAGVSVGPENKLYSGWSVGYGAYGGAVSITDPKTGKTEIIENPLGVRQTISGVAADDKHIYIGTSLGGNGLPSQKSERPRFGVIDRQNRNVIKSEESKGSVTRFHLDPGAHRLILSMGTSVRIYDTEAQAFLESASLPPVTGHYIVGNGEGLAWYAQDKTIHQVDLKTGASRPFAKVPGKPQTITPGKPGELFVSIGPDVMRVTAPSAAR